MKTLKEIVSEPGVYQAVLKDSLKVLDEEVAKKSGLSGLAIKGAYKILKKVQNGRALQKAVEVLMPEFIDKFEPYVARHQQEGTKGSLDAYLVPNYQEIADQLLSVTDKKIKESDNSMVRSTYDKLRPKAKNEVLVSLPALARMIDKYLRT
jgi:hypothetical protein